MSAAAGPGEGAGEHVMIAEDDAMAARVLRSLLQQIGYRVSVAEDGEQALRMLEAEGPPDVLLLDWMLPGISGLEVCHRARQRWNALELPILMVTAKTDPESVYAAFDAGASDYVSKPFRGAELRARIAAQLRVKRLVEERRRIEEHLRERDKLSTLGLLAGGVAHDLANPLAVISGHTQVMLRRGTGGPEVEQQLREMMEAVERCRRIAEDLLGFARRRPVERRAVDVGEVARATLALRERGLSTSGIRLETEIHPALPPVSADAHQLQQVFLNLVVNAEQALRASGSTLRVSVRPAGDLPGVVAEFWNDGPPIPPQVMPSIFDPFFTTKPADEGTGLGLAICRRIVHEHGGEVTVESGAGGTAFRVRLPAG